MLRLTFVCLTSCAPCGARYMSLHPQVSSSVDCSASIFAASWRTQAARGTVGHRRSRNRWHRCCQADGGLDIQLLATLLQAGTEQQAVAALDPTSTEGAPEHHAQASSDQAGAATAGPCAVSPQAPLRRSSPAATAAAQLLWLLQQAAASGRRRVP